MPDNTTFRTPSEPTPETPLPKVKNPPRAVDSQVEVPYLDYAGEKSHPFLVDHFKLGDTWDDPAGGFPEEIERIEGYIADKINQGEIANSVSAVTNLLKSMEKFNNLNREERPVVKLEILSNYVEFLQKNEQTKNNLRRYRG